MAPLEGGRAVVLSAAEAENPLVSYMLDQMGWGDAARVILEDLVWPEEVAPRLPVNRALWQHYAVYRAVKGCDEVLVTLYRGLGYYLMQARPQGVFILPYQSLLLDKLLGAVLSEMDLVGVELEEYIYQSFRDHILCYDPIILDTLDHKLRKDIPAQLFEGDQDPSGLLLGCHFLFLPHPRMKVPLSAEERGTRLAAEETLAWYRDGVVPGGIAALAEGTQIVLVDEGYDVLGLGARLVETGAVARVMRAIDQRKPEVDAKGVTIPGIRSRKYLAALLTAAGQGRYIGYGRPEDFATTTSVEGATATPRLSVVVVYHNRPKFIVALLDAFAAQTDLDFEIIVVDNGSRADLELTNSYPFSLTVLRNMNSYPGQARNIGAGMARGEFVVFFDDDNLPKPGFVAAMAGAGAADRFDLTLCFRDLFTTQSVGEGEEILSRGFQLSAPHLKYASSFRNYIGDNVFVMKRAVFERLRYTDFFEVGREDIEFLQYARDAGLRVGILPEDIYLYRLANADKIGHQHLTHRTREQSHLDYGSYRKYFRSAESFTERKHRQIVDSAVMLHRPGARRARTVWQRFRGMMAKNGAIRALYYRVFK